jgi:hypothetical protein
MARFSFYRPDDRPCPRAQGGVLKTAAKLAAVVSVTLATQASTAAAGYASTALHHTTSYYERTSNPAVLYRQGERAGKAGAQGIVILDFGRPADNGITYGTIGFDGTFLALTSIATAVQSYISGYYRWAPSYTTLDVGLGTNNSCGPGQPCDGPTCGCSDEPANFAIWGGQLALTVELVEDWAKQVQAKYGYTDNVTVVGADDAEPGFDPAYANTYDLLEGYAQMVGGTSPAMVDYGSADADYWTEDQLFQVAYGFRPDVPMPEIYQPQQANEWGQLMQFAKSHHKDVSIFGVLTGGPGTQGPQLAYTEMLQAAATITDQQSIPWLSTMAGLSSIRPEAG